MSNASLQRTNLFAVIDCVMKSQSAIEYVYPITTTEDIVTVVKHSNTGCIHLVPHYGMALDLAEKIIRRNRIEQIKWN